MSVGDCMRIMATLSPEMPVIFYNSSEEPLKGEDYCEGVNIALSRLWDARLGWIPCVMITIGAE